MLDLKGKIHIFFKDCQLCYFTPSSSLLYPPSFRVETSESTLTSLTGIYEKTSDLREHRPVYKHRENENNIFYEGEMWWYLYKYVNLCIPAPHWYIGLLTERKVRSKETDLTVIPLIQWEHLSSGQWTDLKLVNTDPNIQHTFTLNLTINHGEMIIQ